MANIATITNNIISALSGTTSQVLLGDATLTDFKLDSLTDVNVPTPGDGDVLKWNGTTLLWEASDAAGITGSGVAGQVAFFTGATTQIGTNLLFWDNANTRLGIGTNVPDYTLSVAGQVSIGGVGANLGIIINNALGTAIPSSSVKSYIANLNSGFGYLAGSLLLQPRTGVGAALVFATEGTEKVRLTSTGNFIINNASTDNGLRFQVTGDGYFSGRALIGTSSFVGSEAVLIATNSSGTFTQNLNLKDLNASANNNLFLVLRKSDDTYLGGLKRAGTSDAVALYGNSFVSFETGFTERMRLDASGNLGLGVTPSAWGGLRALQVGNQTALVNSGFYTWLGTNWGGSGDVYLQNGFATIYRQQSGEHAWFTAPSGTAGNAITFTQRMTLHQDGNLYLGTGTTNAGFKLDVNGTMKVAGASTFGGNLNLPNTGEYYLQNASSTTFIGLNFDTPYIRFGVGGTVRAFMNATGLGLGTSSPAYRLDVQGTLGVSGASTLTGATTIGADTYKLLSFSDAGGAGWRTTGGVGNAPFMYLYQSGTSGIVQFAINNVARLDINNTGIAVTGASTFGGAISVTGGSSLQATFEGSTQGAIRIKKTGVSGIQLFSNAAGSLQFYNDNTGLTTATLDNSGNLGLGVVPSAWGTGTFFVAQQIGGGGSFIASPRDTSSQIIVGTNAHFNGTNWIRTTANASAFYQQNAGQHIWFNAPTGTAGTATTLTQAMTLTANGRLLLGSTSEGTQTLQVTGDGYFSGSVTGAFYKSTNGTVETVLSYSSTPAGVIGTLTNHPLEIYTNGSPKATFTASGNLGLGVTPSAWRSNEKVLQLGTYTALWNIAFVTALGNNTFTNSSGTPIYLNTDLASRYLQQNGKHVWETAPSGTAGNAITFTQAMTLDASGRLLLGSGAVTSELLQVNGTMKVTGASTFGGVLNANNSGGNIRLAGTTDGGIWTTGSILRIADWATGTKKLDIDLTTGAATFSSSVTATRYFITPDGTNNVYNFVNATSSYAGKYIFQAGGGSAGFGGAIAAYGHSHATKPGWITAGISASSGGKFSVNASALGDSTDVFTVDASGAGVFNSSVTAASLVVSGDATINGVRVGRGPNSLSGNTVLGTTVLNGVTTGTNNVAIGSLALRGTTTGSYNIAIGTSAGGIGTAENTTGSLNIFIGAECQGQAATDSNRTWIGAPTTTSTWLAGNLLLGTKSNSTYRLDVVGTTRLSSTLLVGGVTTLTNLAGAGTAIVVTDNAGNLSTQPTSTYLTSLSGEATNSGSAVTLTNSAVIGKVLTGLNVYSAAIAATDSILAAFGKIQGQIDGLQGGTIYKGSWNANTNTPTITSGTGTQGNYYVVTTAGTTTIDGVSSWAVGDWIIFNGTVWEKIPNVDAITSVNGQTGVVSLTTSNINEGTNLYYTDARARAAISLTTSGSSGASTYSSGVLNIPTYTLAGLGGAAAATTITINGTAQDLSASRTFSVGTVTSVSGTGTVSGLTLTGSITNSGSLTLGGTLTLTSGNVTTALGFTPYNSTNPAGYTTNTGTVTSIVAGTYLTGGTITGSGTIAVDATTTNTADKIVARDASGNFSAGTITATLTGTASNATTAGGLAVHTDRNNEVNKIVRTDANGYIQAGWINTTSGDNGTTAIDRIYASSDAYIRYYTPANFRTVLDVPTRTGGSASGTWGISVTGNAATATNVAYSGLTGTVPTWNQNTTGNAATASTSSQVTINYSNNSDASYQMLWGSGNSVYGTAGITCNPFTDTVNLTGTLNSGGIGVVGFGRMYGGDFWHSGTANNGTRTPTLKLGRFSDSETPAYTIFTDDTNGDILEFYSERYAGDFRLTRNSETGLRNMMRVYSDNGGSVIDLYTGDGSSLGVKLQSNGDARFAYDVVAYYSFSDARLKTNVATIQNPLQKVMAMRGVSYEWNEGYKIGKKEIGLIAQEVMEIIPEVVAEKERVDGSKFLSVDYEHLTGLLIEAVKELKREVDELKSK